MQQQPIPDYLLQYPQIQSAVPRIYNMLIASLPSTSEKKLYKEGHFEVEARFGTLSTEGKHTFQPGVSKEFMNQCLQAVETYQEWKQVHPWEETHDYYYELPPHPEDLRGQGILVRTSVAFQKKDSVASIVTSHSVNKFERSMIFDIR